MPGRRGFLSWVAGFSAWLFLPGSRSRAAVVESLVPLVESITHGVPLREGKVQLDIPRLADNGNSVPLRIVVDNPMTAANHVKSLTLLSEKNPRPLMATFHLGPRAGRPELSTRVRVATSQRILVIAALSDGSFWSGTAEVEVTESACLDAS
jgi:sulfur-oxidizing protein SoxY